VSERIDLPADLWAHPEQAVQVLVALRHLIDNVWHMCNRFVVLTSDTHVTGSASSSTAMHVLCE